MQARGEFFGILMPPPPLGGILPTASMMMGRCEPHTATFECFPCPLGLLRWCITLQLCLPPPNNNEGWPPCGVHNRAACHPFSTRLSEVWSWTWWTPNVQVQVQLVSGPDLDRTLLWIVLKNPFKTSQRTYFLENYSQRYGQNNKNYWK